MQYIRCTVVFCTFVDISSGFHGFLVLLADQFATHTQYDFIAASLHRHQSNVTYRFRPFQSHYTYRENSGTIKLNIDCLEAMPECEELLVMECCNFNQLRQVHIQGYYMYQYVHCFFNKLVSYYQSQLLTVCQCYRVAARVQNYHHPRAKC